MTREELLFIRVLDDLATRIESRDWYELLGASALLRQLLLDGEPLMDAANRRLRLRLRFHVRGYGPPATRPAGAPALVATALGDAIDPEVGPEIFGPGVTGPRDTLLATVVASVSPGRRITIHDTIDFEAHVAGGVHAGSPANVKQQAVADLAGFLGEFGGRPSLRDLRAIGRVVLRGLTPLRDALLAEARG